MIKNTPKPILIRNFAILAVFAMLGYAIPSHILISKTDSLEHNIFIIDRSVDTIEKNDYVVFYLNEKDKFHGGERLIKKVTCTEGNTLTVQDGKHYFCDGKFLGTRLSYTCDGEPLPAFYHNGRIPNGYVFVTGISLKSYDSRYWGFLNKTDVIMTAFPLI